MTTGEAAYWWLAISAGGGLVVPVFLAIAGLRLVRYFSRG